MGIRILVGQRRTSLSSAEVGSEPGMADHTPVEAENGAMPPTYDEAKGLTETMDQKVNIAPSDTKIEMGKEKEKEEEGFKGLSKEELMQFANDPFWVKLRWVLFILFWIIWVAMLAASVVVIIYAPKCPSPEAKQWWQKGPVYTSLKLGGCRSWWDVGLHLWEDGGAFVGNLCNVATICIHGVGLLLDSAVRHVDEVGS